MMRTIIFLGVHIWICVQAKKEHLWEPVLPEELVGNGNSFQWPMRPKRRGQLYFLTTFVSGAGDWETGG